MKPSPCRDCEDRFVGCHGKCEHYLKYREFKDLQLKNKQSVNWDYVEYRNQALNRMSGYRRKPSEK